MVDQLVELDEVRREILKRVFEDEFVLQTGGGDFWDFHWLPAALAEMAVDHRYDAFLGIYRKLFARRQTYPLHPIERLMLIAYLVEEKQFAEVMVAEDDWPSAVSGGVWAARVDAIRFVLRQAVHELSRSASVGPITAEPWASSDDLELEMFAGWWDAADLSGYLTGPAHGSLADAVAAMLAGQPDVPDLRIVEAEVVEACEDAVGPVEESTWVGRVQLRLRGRWWPGVVTVELLGRDEAEVATRWKEIGHAQRLNLRLASPEALVDALPEHLTAIVDQCWRQYEALDGSGLEDLAEAADSDSSAF